MGISIHLSISKSVTKKDWEAVYEETLSLVNAFPLVESREVAIRGIKTVCLIPTKEREKRSGWHNERICTGWFADGEYLTCRSAESYFLPRDLVTDESYDADAPDALFEAFPAFISDDPRARQCYSLWGAKTQGKPYHTYLLAIACLIESRLGAKAFVYGDITRGQCRRAVRMANEHLGNKIDMPSQCDPDRFAKRIKSLQLSEAQMLEAYVGLYLGTQDASFGRIAREQFSEEAFDTYWKEHFGRYQVKMLGFDKVLTDYLLWGFDLEKLAGYVSFVDDKGDGHYDDYVKRIMEARLYLKEKDCRDVLKIDQEEELPYGLPTLFAQLMFSGAANKKIDRFIPLEDIRNALISSVGSKCDVNRLIDDYLEKDKVYQKVKNAKLSSLSGEEFETAITHDASAVFTQAVEKKVKAVVEGREKYDIPDFEYLSFYLPGNTIHPDVAEQAGSYFEFYRGIVKEELFAELMKETPVQRCEWLVFQNRRLLLCDTDWDKIFGDIIDNADSFERYYPMVRVQITDDETASLVRAFVVNDDFYQHAFELEKAYGKKKDDV